MHQRMLANDAMKYEIQLEPQTLMTGQKILNVAFRLAELPRSRRKRNWTRFYIANPDDLTFLADLEAVLAKYSSEAR